MEQHFLVNDIVIEEENCNLGCEYCLTGQSQFKQDHLDQLIFEPPHCSTYAPETELGKRIDALIAASAANLVPVVKVSGGEIFLIRGLMDLLRKLAQNFATLVIQTNGLLLNDEKLREIQSWGNACLQISIDSTRYEANSYRIPSPTLHEKAVRKILNILNYGIPAEIYIVLNDRSLPELENTLIDLLPYENRLIVFPFPVRGPDRTRFFPKREQYHVLDDIAGRYDRYKRILPPRPYLDRLRRFFYEEGRKFRCHLPRFAFSTFDDGWLTSCPNIWFNKIGNVFQEPAREVTDRLGKTNFYQILLAGKPRIDACKACCTPWDMLSMFLDREITLDELCAVPMYSAKASRARILEIANSYWTSIC